MSEIKWELVVVEKGTAPYLAHLGEMRLFVQPIYGDGWWYKNIIQHPDWILTFSRRYRNLDEAKAAIESIALKIGVDDAQS